MIHYVDPSLVGGLLDILGAHQWLVGTKIASRIHIAENTQGTSLGRVENALIGHDLQILLRTACAFTIRTITDEMQRVLRREDISATHVKAWDNVDQCYSPMTLVKGPPSSAEDLKRITSAQLTVFLGGAPIQAFPFSHTTTAMLEIEDSDPDKIDGLMALHLAAYRRADSM
eukprot:10764202-Heterocapsa_arctica.AAC.1